MLNLAKWTVTLALLCVCATAQVNYKRTRDFPIEQWLKEGQRKELPMRLKLYPALLTFHQRHVVHVSAVIDGPKLQRGQVARDLHFIVKARPLKGEWTSRESYAELNTTREFGNQDIEFASDLYFRAGEYEVAAIVHDAVSGQRSVGFTKVRIKPIRRDPLPGMEETLPLVEYLDQSGDAALTLGEGRVNLPLPTTRPVRIDVVLNFSPSAIMQGSGQVARTIESHVTQMGLVLAQIRPEHGCVHVSALDVLGLKVVIDRAQAETIDWQEFEKAVHGIQVHTVSVQTLEGRNRTDDFLREYLATLLSKQSQCAPGEPEPLHVLMVVSDSLLFPPGSKVEKLPAEVRCPDCRVYHIRRTLIRGTRFAFSVPDDQLGGMLKKIKTRGFLLYDSRDFRKAVARMEREIEEASTQH